MCLRLLRCLGVDIPPSTGLLLESRKNGGTFGRMRTTEYTGRTCPLLVRTGLVAAFLAAGVVAGEQSACADGIVRCWGRNYYGECNTPADLAACSSIAGGNVHTIALEAACPQCPSSLTGNCIVSSADLSILLSAWGSCPAGTTGCTGDINHDGQVNGADLGELLNGWGSCPN